MPGAREELLTLETEGSLGTREEQRFFGWSIGILEDAGVVGVLKNDYVYQATTLHGEIHSSSGKPFSFSLSRASVEFHDGCTEDAPLQFTDAIAETEDGDLEASQVGGAFDSARRRSAWNRAWEECTPMRSTHSVIFRDLRTILGHTELAMDVETDLVRFTVCIRRTSIAGVFRYSLTDADTPLIDSPRVVDALLCDAAENAGGEPEPASILGAMIGASYLAQIDPEWLAVTARRTKS